MGRVRRNKGYQRDYYHRIYGIINSSARGSNKTLEQELDEENASFDKRIEDCKKEYEKILKTGLTGKDLQKYCREKFLWEVRFDTDGNLIPLEDVLKKLEEYRRRGLSRVKYPGKISNGYQKRIINKDNQKFCYNSRSGSDENPNCIRVPSLKRSNTVWRRFYELFPEYEKMSRDPNKRRLYKLKKL